ncbi:MAG: MTH865 family protein [Halobacteriales archaeon]|nr:MTH865 family protein [Halobacteriales archaeon]
MTDRESSLRQQFMDAVEPADYPVRNEADIVAVLPDGMLTRFQAGEFSMTAAELAARLHSYQDFPYESPEALVEDLMTGIREEGLL